MHEVVVGVHGAAVVMAHPGLVVVVVVGVLGELDGCKVVPGRGPALLVLLESALQFFLAVKNIVGKVQKKKLIVILNRVVRLNFMFV